jgi:hypothetical protein
VSLFHAPLDEGDGFLFLVFCHNLLWRVSET